MSLNAVRGENMDLIAESNGVEIYKERDWRFSFFASPYPAHREFKAVDIYQGKDFGDMAISPVTGRVFKILRFDSPTPTSRSLPEYLTLIKRGNYLARIMHIKPSVREGDKIYTGDEIGRFINNGYFFFWVDAGMHIEVRSLNNYLRATDGYELVPKFKKKFFKLKSEMIGKVVNTNKRNITVKLNDSNIVKIGDRYTIMDGILSLDYGGVLGRFKINERVYFNGIKIGEINKIGSYMSIFRMEKLGVFANDIEFRGVSFMFDGDIIKLIPKRYGEPLLKTGDYVKIEINRK